MIIKAKINYTIDTTHPDFSCVKDWEEGKVFSYEDTFHINPEWFYGMDDIVEFIHEELALVAGGGYSASHIHSVEYSLEVIG